MVYRVSGVNWFALYMFSINNAGFCEWPYRFMDTQSFGAIQVVELKPGGETINVTQANKQGGFIVMGFDVMYMCKALLSVGGYGMFVSVLEVLPCYTV